VRTFTLAIGVILACIPLAYVCISPIFLEDYLWFLLGIPLFLSIIRVLYEHVPGAISYSNKNRRMGWLFVPDTEVDTEEAAEAEQQQSLMGIWTGTIRIWPKTSDQILRVFPVRLKFNPYSPSARLILTEKDKCPAGIVSADVLEYDTNSGNLDLQVMVDESDKYESYIAKLCVNKGKIENEDETDHVTVELQKTVMVPIFEY